jgi:cAMP-dependent protein kinase regulator
VLADNLLFKHLKEAQLKILVQTMFKSKFKQGEYIIKQGSDGDNFYVVSSGTCGIYKKPVKAGLKFNPSDIGELVYEPKRGDSFGELALLHSAPRVATVVAKTDVELWTVDQRTFTRLLRYLFTKEEPEQLEELPEAEEDDDSGHGQNSFAEADEEEA